ncbi:hypothetical protein L6R53_26540, partial [Myxococcota bacterium]|nr:hypothetical protein [Myxococcota bacterium]
MVQGGRRSRLYILASEWADAVADRIDQAAGDLPGMGASGELKLVCDSRVAGVMAATPEVVAPMDLPAVVLRPRRGAGNVNQAVVDVFEGGRPDPPQGGKADPPQGGSTDPLCPVLLLSPAPLSTNDLYSSHPETKKPDFPLCFPCSPRGSFPA